MPYNMTLNIEINLWKRKWFICGSYNPHSSKTGHHLGVLGKFLDSSVSKYENIVLLGDFNCVESDSAMENCLYSFNLKNLVKRPTCFKNVINPRTIDFFHNDVIETSLSNFHHMPLTVLKCNYIKCKPIVITYRCFKHFDISVFRQDLMHALNAAEINITYGVFEDTYLRILHDHAPLKKYIYTWK